MPMRETVITIGKRTKLYPLYNKLRRSVYKGAIKRILHIVTCGPFVRGWKIRQYLRGDGPKKLQVGSGYHTKKGWLNGDLIAGDIYLNATRRFPFPDASFDYVFAEQFIEHLSFYAGAYCLSECSRVLKRGGKIRLSTPDFERLYLLYKDQNPGVDLKTAMTRHRKNHNLRLTTACHFINDFFRLWGHSFIYDEETLLLHLGSAGFTNVDRKCFGSSDNPYLRHLEIHADAEWMKNAFQIVLEAEKT
jgi:predicted SAM-dependent methyltransferase